MTSFFKNKVLLSPDEDRYEVTFRNIPGCNVTRSRWPFVRYSFQKTNNQKVLTNWFPIYPLMSICDSGTEHINCSILQVVFKLFTKEG